MAVDDDPTSQAERLRTAAAAAALTRVFECISRASGRQSFIADPEETLLRAGIPVEALPKRVLNTLKMFSEPELRMLAQLNSAMIAEGLTLEALGSAPDERLYRVAMI